jgi:hypothetical protein
MNGRNQAMRWSRGAGALCLSAALLLSACGEAAPDEPVLDEPAIVEHLEGSDVARITLTSEAVDRVQIQTVQVMRARGRVVVPSSAVLVDPEGVFWVYTNPEPLVFIRHEISIDHEDGGEALLLDGPPVRTRVVTVGVAELYGAEFEIGH